MAKGRALAQLIMHMSHLTPVGWGYFACSVVLLMSLELFVVVSKMGDQECDYEMAIKGAQRVKVAQFAAAFGKVNDFKV